METQYISLNMTPTGVNPCFHISQYDVGRMLGFIVHSGGATVDLDTYTCTIEATRSDGTAITSAVATTDNIGTFEVTPTMSNKADKYKCQLVIVDENSKRIASLPFDMEVTKAAMDEDSESIEEDASLYQQYTGAVKSAIADINADMQTEKTSRATTDASLQAQINQLVAPSGEAPSAAEVQNARIGADGVTYDTLGNAIRGQVSDLKSAFDYNVDGNSTNLSTIAGYLDDKYIGGRGNPQTMQGWCITGYVERSSDLHIEFISSQANTLLVQYLDSDRTIISDYKRVEISLPIGRYEFAPANIGSYIKFSFEKAKTVAYGFPNVNRKIETMVNDALAENWHLYLDKTSFELGYYNVNGQFQYGASLTNWIGHRKYLHVGNASKIIFHHEFSKTLQLNLFKYNKAKETISLLQILIDPNEYYYHNIEEGTYFYAVSINDPTSSESFSVDAVNPKAWLIEYNCTADMDDSCYPNNPEFNFNAYGSVGANETYNDLGVAYNGLGGHAVLLVEPGTYHAGDHGFMPNDCYMIGKGEGLVRVENGNATYPYASTIIAGEGYIENVYFFAGNGSTTANGGYAIHLENNRTQGKTVYFKNCTFEAEWQSGFGTGLRKDMNLVFENCHFINDWEIQTGTNVKKPDDYTTSGALFFHGSIDSQNYGTQHITCINCTFKSKGAGALRIETVEGNLVIATFINCNFFSEYYGAMNPVDIIGGAEHGYLCGSSVKLGKASHGNNIPCLNADAY